jgi:hypothetical protein
MELYLICSLSSLSSHFRNYAPGILPQVKAAEKGYSQILWLLNDYLTEVGTMNFFLFWKNKHGSVSHSHSIIHSFSYSLKPNFDMLKKRKRGRERRRRDSIIYSRRGELNFYRRERTDHTPT